MTNKLFIKYRIGSKLSLFISMLVVGLAFTIIFSGKANATTPDQLPSVTKSRISSYDSSCPSDPNQYVHDTWISRAGDPSQTSVFNVNYGDTYVDLQYNESIFLCRKITNVDARTYPGLPNDGTPKPTAKLRNNSTRINSRSVVPATSGSIAGIPPGTITDNNYNGSTRYWFTNPPGFRYNSNSPFTTTQTVDIHLSSTQVNTFASGVSNCVGGGGQVGSSHDFDRCPADDQIFTIQIVVGPPPTATVQGNIFHYPDGAGISPVSISFCGTNPGATTGTDPRGSGFFTTQINNRTGFCISPNSIPAGYDGPFIRPWGEGYGVTSCGSFGAPPSSPPYCSTITKYDWQVANEDAKADASYNGSPPATYDRSSDGGYDFAVIDIPQPTCGPPTFTLASGGSFGSSVEPGVSYQVTGSFVNNADVAYMRNSDYSANMVFTDDAGNPVPPTPSIGFAPVAPHGTATLPSGFRRSTPGKYTATVTLSGPRITTLTCPYIYTVASKPYLRVYGGDVQAGASVDELTAGAYVCKAIKSAGIAGYNDGTGAGSGTQYAAQAMAKINGFGSAQGRPQTPGQDPIPILGLDFANTSTPGNFGTASCNIDYFDNPNRPLGVTAASYGSSSSSGSFYYNSNTTLGGITVLDTKRQTVYVEGNLTLSSNIQYAGTSWTNLTDIPSLYIIVKGDIYINSTVTQLDGVYIAQKNPNIPSGGGHIYTCTNNSLKFQITLGTLDNSPSSDPTGSKRADNATYINACNRNLSVNGAFIADTIKFQRTNGSLKNSNNTQPSNNSDIAETFIYSPELWLVPPPFTNGSTINYSSVTALPPVL